MLHKERKNYFLGLIEVSINTMYKHEKAKEYIYEELEVRKKNTHTRVHTIFPT